MMDVAAKVFKIVLFSDYPTNAEEIPKLPFIGHAYLFIGGPEDLIQYEIAAIFNRVLEFGRMYPATLRLSLGYYSISATTFPDHLKEILLSPKAMEKDLPYTLARPWVGDGLVTAPASIWEVHRKLLQPSFNPMVLKSYIQTFSTQSVILAKNMEQHVDGPEFKIYRPVSLCTFDAICGSKYAMMLMKTITATILQKYVLIKDNVIPVKDLRLKGNTLLKSVDPDTVRIERRVKYHGFQ